MGIRNINSKMEKTVSIRYFAYNCTEIKLPDGKTIVIDPCLKKDGRYACGYDVDALEGCDYILINHTHMDHIASLGKVYDKFHSLIMTHGETAYELANYFDIPFIKIVPFYNGDIFNYGSFKVKIIKARHNPAKMFMARPSGRVDETANDSFIKNHLSGLNDEETYLENMGSIFNSNFLITLQNGIKIALFTGNPGMIEPDDESMWKDIHPDIILAHRAPTSYENWAGRMANILEITGAKIMVPIHIDNKFLETENPECYVDEINKICRQKAISGKAVFMVRAKWYKLFNGELINE